MQDLEKFIYLKEKKKRFSDMDIDELLKDIINYEGVIYKKEVSLKKYNTYALKAVSKHFFIPENIGAFSKMLSLLNENKMDYLILGGGSNILFLDDVINIPVIYTGFFTRIQKLSDKIIVYSGAKTSDVVKFACKNSMTGIEFLSGLPGSVGGATYMNARCYGFSISEYIDQVGVIDESGEYFHISNEKCNFGYKKSIFQQKKYVIIDVTFNLELGTKKIINTRAKCHKNDRKSKHQYKYPSAGCVFLNDYEANIVAGKVIDELALRGTSVGGASISPHHANFIISKNASGKDIYQLINNVRDKVLAEKNIKLCPEIRIVSSDSSDVENNHTSALDEIYGLINKVKEKIL